MKRLIGMSNSLRLKVALLWVTIVIFSIQVANAQASSKVEYLEVVVDSSDSVPTYGYVVAINNYQPQDSLLLKLISEEGLVAFEGRNTINYWMSNYPNRVEATKLYLTIDVGSHEAIGRFSAEALTVVNGISLSGKLYGEHSY